MICVVKIFKCDNTVVYEKDFNIDCEKIMLMILAYMYQIPNLKWKLGKRRHSVKNMLLY